MRKKSVQRHDDIVRSAGQLFLRDGYAQASMDAIAKECGCSKATLYNYFDSKEMLFAAFVQAAGEDFIRRFPATFAEDESTASKLERVGLCILEVILSPDIIALNRLVIGECNRYPEIGELFYQNGIRQSYNTVAEVMKLMIAAGEIHNNSVHFLASQFVALCMAPYNDMRFIKTKGIHKIDMGESVRVAVQCFLKLYGNQ